MYISTIKSSLSLNMDFARLPDTIILKIFEYLPLENCIRVGRVNKLFRQKSQLATSLTKSLDLSEYRFKKIIADQFTILLDLCSPNLEAIKFPYFHKIGIPLATVFANFQFPRLVNLELNDIPIDSNIFDQMIRNCPKMESLIWWGMHFVGFPEVTNNNLKKLFLDGVVKDVGLESLIGKCPNLEDLYLEMKNASVDVLDQFLASVPHLQKVIIRTTGTNSIAFEKMVNLWKLPLTSLSIAVSTNADKVLQKVAASFQNLQTLRVYTKQIKPSIVGVAQLARLEKLEVLYLDIDQDDVIRQLFHCQKLRKLELYSSLIIGGTLVGLFRWCSRLESIAVPSIREVDSPEEAAVVLEGLSGMAKRDILIGIYPNKIHEFNGRLKSIWDTEPVKEMVKVLGEKEGLKIKIEII